MDPAGGTSILLVEDHAQVRGMIAATLKANGFQVTAVPGMQEAVDAVRAHRGELDVVLSDVRLAGGRNGIELADWITEHADGIVVVLMSALGDASLASYRFLQKPFTESELLGALRDALT